MAKKIVNIRLRPDQEERINAIVERSAILDTSKFVRIAVDWLLRSDIGEVIKTIVDDEKFPDYTIPKDRRAKKQVSQQAHDKILARFFNEPVQRILIVHPRSARYEMQMDSSKER